MRSIACPAHAHWAQLNICSLNSPIEELLRYDAGRALRQLAQTAIAALSVTPIIATWPARLPAYMREMPFARLMTPAVRRGPASQLRPQPEASLHATTLYVADTVLDCCMCMLARCPPVLTRADVAVLESTSMCVRPS